MARKTSPRGGFFTSEPTVSVGSPSLRGGFFKKEEQQPTPASPSELLTRALQSLVGAGKDQPNNTLSPAKQAAAISEGYGVGRPSGGGTTASVQGGIASPLTEKTVQQDVDGQVIDVPDREYYDPQRVEDDYGNYLLFKPIKTANFLDSNGNEVVIQFAEPSAEQYKIEEV